MATAVTEFDLEMAILSMDAYNQPKGGVDGMQILPKGSLDKSYNVGNATFVPNTNDSFPSTGFYAAEYTYDGQTIIAYRGTVSGNSEVLYADMLNGWTLSARFAAASQAQEALDFYNQVAASSANIILTGHSLGGCLG